MSDTNTEIKLRALLKKSLDTINQLNAQKKDCVNDPIAIIGMSCRLPGGIHTPEAFWRLLLDRTEAVADFPKNEQLRRAFEKYISASGDCYTSKASYLDEDTTAFDARFFSLAPKEVKNMDPQQRMALELVWEAIERAGYNPLQLPAKTGVFVGVIGSEYGTMEKKQRDMGPYTATGSLASITSGRISHFLNVNGPSLSIDTACSSSLVALHLAIKSLQSGECDIAIAGGINLFGDPAVFRMLCQIDALSPDGKCKTFSEKADGYGRGEGGGFIVLKRLPDAQQDSDNILSSIVSSVVNHDGKSSGLTVPNGKAQEELLSNAIHQANITAADVDFIELHGTGTALGDPIEVQAIQNVYADRQSMEPLLLTGLKSNIGHLEAAAGIVGVIKATLCLMYKTLPPQVLDGDFNPRINFNDTNIEVPLTQKQLSVAKRKYYGGVSSFGFSGCNSHVILRREESTSVVEENTYPEHLICISARSDTALHALIKQYRDLVEKGNIDLGSLAFTANIGRTHFNYRMPFLVKDLINFRNQLDYYLKEQKVNVFPVDNNVSKKFTLFIDGFITLHAINDKIKDLYSRYATFRETIDEIDSLCMQLKYLSVKSVLFQVKRAGSSGISSTAMFAFHVASARLVIEMVGKPDFFVGTGLGQVAIAYLTGSLSLSDAITFVKNQEVDKDTRLISYVNDNRKNDHVISTFPFNGSFVYMETAINGDITNATTYHFEGLRFAAIDKKSVTDQFLEKIVPPKFAVLSSQTGGILTKRMLRQDWLLMLTGSSHMELCLETLKENDATLIIGISFAGSIYSELQNQIFSDTFTFLPIADMEQRNSRGVPHLLAALYKEGMDINWSAYYKNIGGEYRRKTLPTYPFERKSYCSDFIDNTVLAPVNEYPFGGKLLSLPIKEKIVQFAISIQNLPGVKDTHDILHIGYYHEMLLSAYLEVFHNTDIGIGEINFLEPLLLTNEERVVQVVFDKLSDGNIGFSVNALHGASWICYATGHIITSAVAIKDKDISELQKHSYKIDLPKVDFYNQMKQKGIELGNSVCWINELHIDDNIVCGDFISPYDKITNDIFPFNITSLDACAQQFNAFIPPGGDMGYMVESITDISFVKRVNNTPAKCITILKKYNDTDAALEGELYLINDTNEILYSVGYVKMKGVKAAYWDQLKKMQASLGRIEHLEQVLPESITIDYVIKFIRSSLSRLMDLPETDILLNSTLADLGCDSLMSLQLKRNIDSHFQVDFLLSNLVGDVSVVKLSELIIDKIFNSDTRGNEQSKMNITNKWIKKVSDISFNEPALRLYCFPYGGGGASVFQNWQGLLKNDIEVCAIQLPGREDRSSERFLTDINDFTGILTDIIAKEDDKPFAFYGHSAGALMAYAVADALQGTTRLNLVKLFCAGFSSPTVWPNPWYIDCNNDIVQLGFTGGLSILPDAQNMDLDLLSKMHKIFKLPFDFLGNESFTRTAINILVSDMRLIGSFKGGEQLSPLACPITAFAGQRDDRVKKEDIRQWTKLTSDKFSFTEFSGDHFFLSAAQNEKELTRIIREELNEMLKLK